MINLTVFQITPEDSFYFLNHFPNKKIRQQPKGGAG